MRTRALSFGPAASSGGGPSDFRRPTLSQFCYVNENPRTAMCVRNVDVHVSCRSHVDAQFLLSSSSNNEPSGRTLSDVSSFVTSSSSSTWDRFDQFSPLESRRATAREDTPARCPRPAVNRVIVFGDDFGFKPPTHCSNPGTPMLVIPPGRFWWYQNVTEHTQAGSAAGDYQVATPPETARDVATIRLPELRY